MSLMPRLVWIAAAAAVLGRFQGLLWPLRPDEAGFLLVAQAWSPTPDSPYGHYWVDRPPQIIWLMKLTDELGGPYFHRLLGAVGCGLLVLAAAAAAREIAHQASLSRPDVVRRAMCASAVLSAAFVTNPEIDGISAKGELLGIPLVMGACWLALRAARLEHWPSAFVGGLFAVLAMGMKQNLVGGLVFGGAILLGSLLTRRLTGRGFSRLALAAAVGAALPALATITWALAAGVRLEALSYAVIGFRLDASEVLSSQPTTQGATERMDMLAVVFVGTGMALAAAWFLVRLPRMLRHLPVPAVATLLLLIADGFGVVASGSFWLPYLLVLIPGLALGLACVVLADQHEVGPVVPRLTRVVVVVAVVSTVLGLIGWVGWWIPGRTSIELETGKAIAESARPGDTLLVFGGRADIQWASGMDSPYPYLWSLPMRTRDHGYRELREVMTGPTAPTWVVEVTQLNTWTELGVLPIEHSLLRKYELVDTACGRYRVFHLNTVEPVDFDVDCGHSFRFIW